MVKDDDQKTASGSIADGSVEDETSNVVEDSDKVVKQRPSSSNASQPSELQHDEEAEELKEDELEQPSDDLRTLEDELNKITASVPTMYAVLV